RLFGHDGQIAARGWNAQRGGFWLALQRAHRDRMAERFLKVASLEHLYHTANILRLAPSDHLRPSCDDKQPGGQPPGGFPGPLVLASHLALLGGIGRASKKPAQPAPYFCAEAALRTRVRVALTFRRSAQGFQNGGAFRGRFRHALHASAWVKRFWLPDQARW